MIKTETGSTNEPSPAAILHFVSDALYAADGDICTKFGTYVHGNICRVYGLRGRGMVIRIHSCRVRCGRRLWSYIADCPSFFLNMWNASAQLVPGSGFVIKTLTGNTLH